MSITDYQPHQPSLSKMTTNDPFQIETGVPRRRARDQRLGEEVGVIESSFEPGTSLSSLNTHRNVWLLVGVAGAVLVVLFIRMIDVQIVRGASFRLRSDSNRVRTVTVPAPRGAIVDRNGASLAENVPNITITITPADLPKAIPDREKLLARISAQSGIPEKDISTALQSTQRRATDPVIIREQLTYEEAMKDLVALADIPAVSVISLPNRSYPNGKLTSTILGYTGHISPEQLLQDPSADLLDIVGKTGLEFSYNQVLTGQDGLKNVERDVNNREQRILSQQETVPGQTVITTIDLPLQKILAERLQATVSGLRAPGGAAIAIDPQSGEILALASAPSYDDNLFVTSGKSEEVSRLLTDKKKPLLNRVISGQYPSGSIIKPLISSAALAERIISSSTTVLSVGGFKVGNDFFPDWKAGGHGLTNVTKAIAESVNTFFYAVGGGFDNITGLGVDRIVTYLQKFGWGSVTGVDLPAEADGFLPTKEWRTTQRPSPWKLGDTYHLSIGQGDLEVTPIQVANAIAAVANNGTLYEPHVVKEIRQANGSITKTFQPKIETNQVVSKNVLKTVQAGMRQGVLNGSSRALQSLPVTSAGKTGTAQFGNQEKTHAWFAAYAPYEQPKIVIVVLIEAGGEGNATALPVAKDTLQWYFTEGAGKTQ